MHSATAILHTQPFQLGYPPSSSGGDCTIGSQRIFSPSAAFPGDEENHSRRIGSIGHSLSDSGVSPSPNGLPYSPRDPGLQNVQYAPVSGGLLMSPTDGTSADNLVSNPTSLYSQQVNSWPQRMPDFASPPRIPTLHPAATPTSSLQGSGSSQANNSIMSRDSYPAAYSLSRTFQSPPASLTEFPRYSYSSGMQPGFASHPDPTMYPYLQQSHRQGQMALDAPPFKETENFHHITTNNQQVTPSIHAKIHKGFFKVENKWTCYRRNYFSVSCSFGLQPSIANATYYLQTAPGQHVERITNFAVSISAVVNASENEIRELVQHTPKRDKQSEKKPEKVVLRPYQPYHLGSNVVTPGGLHTSVYGMPQQMDYSYAALQQTQPPTQHTFERIQFQKATANNGKRRAQQQYYNLVVELHAEVNRQDGLQWVKIAKRVSDQMVVRGRSPGHYKDGRRDSSASTGDSHGGRGSLGDAGRGIVPSSIDPQPYSHMQYLYGSSQRGDPQYSNNRDVPRHHHHQPQFGQIDHSGGISPLVSASDGSLEFMFSDSIGGPDSTDGSLSHHSSSRYHDNDDNNSLRRDSGSTGSSNQSHVPSLDLSSSTASQDGGSVNHHHTLDDTFDPMISSYHSEQEDGSQYLKQTSSERCPLASIVNDSSHCSRTGSGAVSFSRFDPIQESLCT